MAAVLEDLKQVIDVVGNAAPIAGKVVLLLGAIIEQAAMVSSNKVTCQALADRVKHLEQPLKGVIFRYPGVTSIDIQRCCAENGMANCVPLLSSLTKTLLRALKFVQKYGDMCQFRQFASAKSIKSKFKSLMREIDSASQDMMFMVQVQSHSDLEFAST